MEVIYQAISDVLPDVVPACSGGDICSLVWWGARAEAATRFSPTEVWESKNPWLLEKVELATDSCGPGKHRGTADDNS